MELSQECVSRRNVPGRGIDDLSRSRVFFFFFHSKKNKKKNRRNELFNLLFERRSSTWGSQLNEINRARRKVNDKSLSNTIHLLSVTHLAGNYNPTDEKEKLLERETSNSGEEKRNALTKENETLGHGYFEDEELVNVVQDLVISRYARFFLLFISPASHHFGFDIGIVLF